MLVVKTKCICGVSGCKFQGLCHCGCGKAAKLSTSTRYWEDGSSRDIRGLPRKFLANHRAKAGLRAEGGGRPKGSQNKAIEAQMAEFETVFTGQCFCGCGEQTEISTQTRVDSRDGSRIAVAGLPKRYVDGHEPQRKKGTASPFHKGTRITSRGYIKVYRPGHARADGHGFVCEHILVMEEHLGRPLYKGAPGPNRKDDEEVHHKDGNKQNNALGNLQLMTHASHMKHHRWVQKAGGNRG